LLLAGSRLPPADLPEQKVLETSPKLPWVRKIGLRMGRLTESIIATELSHDQRLHHSMVLANVREHLAACPSDCSKSGWNGQLCHPFLHFPRTQSISQPSPLLDSSDRKVCRPRLPLRRLRCICPEPRFPGRSWWFYVMRCTSVSAPALGDVLCPELDCLVQLEISAEARTGGSLHQARWTLVAGFELWFELPHVLMTCKCVSGARARGTGSSAGPGRWVTSEAP
jgi:hypothetical protein